MDELLSADGTQVGELQIPSTPQGVIVVTPADRAARAAITAALHDAHFATLHLGADDPQPVSHAGPSVRQLTKRVLVAADVISAHPALSNLPIGIFGTDAGGVAALAAACARPERFRAIVSRGSSPDLGSVLDGVRAATLFIADGLDDASIVLNQEAMTRVKGIAELEILPAAPAFDDPGSAAHVARLARRWFARFLP